MLINRAPSKRVLLYEAVYGRVAAERVEFLSARRTRAELARAFIDAPAVAAEAADAPSGDE